MYSATSLNQMSNGSANCFSLEQSNSPEREHAEIPDDLDLRIGVYGTTGQLLPLSRCATGSFSENVLHGFDHSGSNVEVVVRCQWNQAQLGVMFQKLKLFISLVRPRRA